MRCTATTSAGEPCKRSAISGGKVCMAHGGAAPQVKAMAAVRAEVAKWNLGDATDDPGETLLRLITQSRQRVELYAAEIERKVEDGMHRWGGEFTLERILVGDSIISAGGEAVKSGEYIRGLVDLESQERDRLASMSAKAIAAGLEERRVRLLERQGNLIATLLQAVMNNPALAFTVEQRRALPEAIRHELERAKSERSVGELRREHLLIIDEKGPVSGGGN